MKERDVDLSPTERVRYPALVSPNADDGSEPSLDQDIEEEAPTRVGPDAERTLQGDSKSSGRLGDTTLARLLFELYANAFDGALLLRKETTTKVIYFKGGYPIATKSNNTEECLGKILQWDGAITEAQRRESLLLMRRTGHRQGSVLLDLGLITGEQLTKGLALQARFRICEAFSWTVGTYKICSPVSPAIDSQELDVSPATLIVEGVHSFMPHQLVLDELRPLVDRYLLPSENPLRRYQRIELHPERVRLLELVDGTRTVSEILRASPASVQETAALLYALHCTEIVTDAQNPKPGRLSLSIPSPAPLAQRDLASREKNLKNLVERLRVAAPNVVLGVPEDAPLPTLTHAFHQRARERHPDVFGAGVDGNARALALEALTLTADAHQQLIQERLEKESTPPELDSDAEEPPNVDERVGRILEGERHHQRGLELLERGRFAEATRLLARAVSACDDEAEFRASLAWAVFQSGLDHDAARRALELLDGVPSTGRSTRATLFRGHILAFLDRSAEAQKMFEQILSLEPDHEEARCAIDRIRELES